METLNPSNSTEHSLTPVGELFKNAFVIYKEVFLKMILFPIYAGLIGFVPVAIVLLLWGVWSISAAFQVASVFHLVINLILGFFSVVALLFMLYVTGVGFITSYLILKDPSIKFKPAMTEARKCFWQYYYVSVLSGLAVMGGVILLIIPGLIFWVWFAFSSFVFMFEGLKGVAALKRSKELAKGYWWPIVGRFAILFAISLILGVPTWSMNQGSFAYESYSLLSSIIKFLIGPFYIVIGYLIFKELQQFKGESKIVK